MYNSVMRTEGWFYVFFFVKKDSQQKLDALNMDSLIWVARRYLQVAEKEEEISK